MDNIFDNLSEGILDIENLDGELMTEAYFPKDIPYLKTLRRQVLLPQDMGKGNVCFLYSHNQQESIKMITNTTNFSNKNRYRYYYYNTNYIGKLYNKRYRFKDLDIRKTYYKNITDNTNLLCRLNLDYAVRDNKNLYYELFRYLEIFENICSNLQIMKYISLFWNYFKDIIKPIPGYNNHFILVNLENYPIGKKVKDNLTNPLFMIYYTLYKRPELLKDINIDFYFYAGKKVLKVNPSLCNEKSHRLLRIEMRKIMTGISNISDIDKATDTEIIDKEEIVDTVTNNIADKVIVPDNDEVITTNDALVKYNATSNPIKKEIKDKVNKNIEEIVNDRKNAMGVTPNVTPNTKIDPETVENDVRKELENDRKIIEDIYYQNKKKEVGKKKSVASSARDAMLREEQQNINVKGTTIKDIEKSNAYKIQVPVKDVSKSLTTSNDNVKSIKFANHDKTYNEKLMKKDLVDAILALNDKSIPMFIRDIQVKDTSDELNYKDTYTIMLEDANRKRHNIKVDIPKFIDDTFLYIGGNKKSIKHQSFSMPVVKISPDMVQIVTNYSKMTIARVSNKSISSIERIRKLTSKNEEFAKLFIMGNSYNGNKECITTIEYDDLSKTYTSFKNGNTFIMFNQQEATDYMAKNNIKPRDKYLFIGKDNGKNCFINIDTQLDDNNKSIVDIILDASPDDIKAEFDSIKAPKRLMYANVKVMAQTVNVGMLLGLWEGLTTVMKKLNISYRLEDKVPRDLPPNEEFIKFSDCVMIYKQDIPTSLIMNGIRMFDTSKYSITDFDGKLPYIDYIKKVYGKAIIENALLNFYEFSIDPITLEILQHLNLPTDIVSLMIYAVKLLSDSQYIYDINMNFYRIRHGEIIPAILYEKLAKNYVTYRNNNGRKKFNIPQDCVIKEILGLKTVEDYSTLNPFKELDTTHDVSTKGFRGINLDDAYTPYRRSYDPSMTGILAAGTSPDGTVGIKRSLTLEPQITNLRGFIEDNHENLDKLKDVNLFSPVELSMPGTAVIDDPNRLGHAVKQSNHVIPVKKTSPVLISNGLDESARFHLTSNFVINADEDGEIIDYDPELKVMIAKYKSGKCRAIDLSPNIVKNGGGGFFLSNVFKTDLKVGDKFKANDVLAYHKDFFKNDKFNNCRMTVGSLVKIAIMSTYNTYEDSTFITHKMSEDCATEMCFKKACVVGKNSNVFYMVEKGQEISVGDSLIQFDTSYEDETLNMLLANLGAEDKENILEGARNEIKSKYSGVIEDIKIYSTVDLDDMSPSLRKIVGKYYRNIKQKKDFLSKYDPDSKEGIMKCGLLLTDANHKVQPNKFGVIRGEHVEDSVLIEFYIKHEEPLEIGSKIAHFTALKNTIGEIIPRGYEPYSSYRPDEEVSTVVAGNSVLNRMTPSILITVLGNKCIIELKRHLKELNYDRKKMEDMIYKFFTAFDKTGANTKKYKELFQPMSDNQFKNYFKEFFANEDAYLILDIIDYERTITIEDIERAAKVIDVPLFEYVTMPHLSMDKSNCVTCKEPVPVGYINEKRTQQTVGELKK